MSIDTSTEKLGIMEWCSVYEPGLPLSPGAFDQADQQQLLNDFPGLLWNPAVAGRFILDMNTRLFVYLCTLYGMNPSTADLTSMICRYLDEQTSGDYDERFQKLIDEATP